MITRQAAELRARLARALLPATADAIAGWFMIGGTYGYRGLAMRCPIANYPREATGASQVLVDEFCAELYFDAEGRSLAVSIESTPGWSEFMLRFDAGQYPGLVAPGADGAVS